MNALIEQASKTQQTILESLCAAEASHRNKQDACRNVEKFRRWQDNWSGRSEPTDATFEALWGVQGADNIRKVLTDMLKASKELKIQIAEAQEGPKPHSKWSHLTDLLGSKVMPLSELHSFVAMQRDVITSLSIYSDAVFDSLHGAMAEESLLPSTSRPLTSAIQSRTMSMQLYRICVESRHEWSLQLGLLDARPGSPNPSLQEALPASRDERPLHASFKLLAQSRRNPLQIQKIIIENTLEERTSGEEQGGPTAAAEALDHLLSTQSTEATTIQPFNQKSNSSSCPHLPKSHISNLNLKSRPVSLADILNQRQQSPNPTPNLPRASKIELACRILESALFLLGTPWFAILDSNNLLRFHLPGHQQHTYILKAPILDPSDLHHDDPNCLSETSQLHRIGVLLAEIALNRTATTEENESDIMKILPAIERAMGLQYCQATAFCLMYRRPRERFHRAEKYGSVRGEEWKGYLVGFLRDFYELVYLRMKEDNHHDEE